MSHSEILDRPAGAQRPFGTRGRPPAGIRRATAGIPKPAPIPSDKRADLEAFFGPRSDTYLKIYDRVMEKKRWLCWPAFFLGFVWFFYRKMYLLGAMFLVLPIVLALIINSGVSGTSFGVAVLLSANSLYVGTANNRMKKADRLSLTGDERTNYLRRAGGVSVAAGTLGALIYVGMIVAAIVAAVADKS